MRVYSKLAGRKGAVYVPFATFFRNKKMLVYSGGKFSHRSKLFTN